MISVKQILYWTMLHRKSIISKARSVALRFGKVEYQEEDGIKMKMVEAYAQSQEGDGGYRILLYFTGKGPTSKVWASCECPYFLYHAEVALQKRGSTDINFSNGKLPKITNPRLVAHACKHVVAALQRGAFMLEPKKTATRTRTVKK